MNDAEPKRSRQVDMTHGPLGKKILLFALPIALTGVLQQLFNAADVAVVGQFASADAMAAVGSNSATINLMVTFFLGISMGANVVAARYTGRGDAQGVQKTVYTAIVISLLGGLLLTAVGEAASGPLLHLMGVPDKIFSMAETYLRIYIGGMPVILLYNFEAALFRSQGNVRTPLICLIISGLLNVVLNLFFVIVCHMDVDGVALATVISNVVSSLLLFGILLRGRTSLHINWHEFRPDRSVFRQILGLGLPAGLQGMVFSLSNMVIQSAVNSLGTTVMAASAAALNVEVVAYLLVNGYGQACTTFIGQNYGAGDFSRCRRVTKIGLGQSLLVTALSTLLLVGTAPYLIRLFNGNADVIAYGAVRVRIIVGFECVNCILEILSGSMRGYGHSLVPSMVALVGICGSRIAWVYTVFPAHHTFTWLLMAYPVSWILTALVMIAAYFILREKTLRPYFRSREVQETQSGKDFSD